MSQFGKGKVEVLSDKTYCELNIDFSQLSAGSHKKIFVKCQRCEEEFLRERRLLHQLHACPTHRIREDGVKLKWCNKCKSWLTYAVFNNDAARCDGLTSWCKDCCAKAYNATSTIKFKPTTFAEWLDGYYIRKKKMCARDNIKFEISKEDLHSMWTNQCGRCYYSNALLTFGSDKLNSSWLERLDPSLGYVPNNVVWTSKALNCMKNSATEEEFYEFLANANIYKQVPIRLECKLIHPDAKLPFRKRTTDAGHDLYSIEDVTLKPHECVDVRTGIIISIPPGWYYSIEGRSSMWKNGVSVFPATIDSTYCGECMAALINISDVPYEIKKGDRVAQIVVQRQYSIDMSIVSDFGPKYNQRGQAGYGSTGK